ncbi:hypothetical protein DLJ53_33455 [Acuticoccus sediminis]|uniref:Uncharacterized protein n=1 Tax=Acuticoccus sediminis TaxID=2184697 RepID=A0A8B2NEX7_9HYPH|nr:hypothetical protein [Acuticoccus sediminis]RAH96057.1 hypothetical protein DLJ53_33455 [Acuticoccus sediminis]
MVVPVIVQGAALLRDHVYSQSQGRAGELALAVRREELAWRIEQLEYDAELARHQKEVMLSMISAGDAAHARKIDAVMEAFRGVLGVLTTHQRMLESEKDMLSRSFLSPDTTDALRVEIRRRQREIDVALEEIDESAVAVQAIATETVRRIDPQMPPLMLR